ncbi:hypothetical protein ACEN8I_00080 [Polaromonas sp. CT11-55]|uniref:hypothetical protein n=1 Tax=Polaromonas sp. CT11-55 TaxID=3243045 RepID=UPI0039A786F0
MESKLEISVGEYVDQLRRVEIWIDGERLTGDDPFVYPEAFLTHLIRSRDHLKTELNFLKHEAELMGLGIDDAFERVSSGNLHTTLRVLDWGPTTDDYLCFLLPIQSRLWLTWKRQRAPAKVRAIQILPYELISAIEVAADQLRNGDTGDCNGPLADTNK